MPTPTLPPFQRALLITLALAMCSLQTGCVRRRLTVHSNPPGALVYVDNQQIGTTPCSVDFIYYGTREIRLVKPGFDTLTINQPIPTPWYQFPPLDFVSENLVPAKIRDNRTVTYNLSPQMMIPTEELIQRGEQLRQATMQQAAAPPSYISPPSAAEPSIVPPPATFPPNGTAPPPVVTTPPNGVFAPPPAAVPAGPGVVLPQQPSNPSSPPFRY